MKTYAVIRYQCLSSEIYSYLPKFAGPPRIMGVHLNRKDANVECKKRMKAKHYYPTEFCVRQINVPKTADGKVD